MSALRFANKLRTLTLHPNSSCFKLLAPQFSSKTNNPVSQDPLKKKKTTPIPKITLISPDESIQICTVDEAQKISRRRDLKLVKIVDLDTKTQRPVFKLMTGTEYHAEDLKQRELRKNHSAAAAIKGEKLLLLNAKISEHDLEARLKSILKWIHKKYEIRVVITGEATNMELCEHVYKKIEEHIKTEGRLLQKRSKNNELKFQILPPKASKEDTSETSTL